jgi:hypothetical protein
MSAQPLHVPDEFGEGTDTPSYEPRPRGPRYELSDPDDPNSEYVQATETVTSYRPLVAARCQRIKIDGMRCRQWSLTTGRYCVKHSGYQNLPNVREYHEQTLENARLTLLRMVPNALDTIKSLMTDDSGDTPATVRLKASTETLDRIGVRGGADLNITVEEAEDPTAVLMARLDQLRQRLTPKPAEIEDAEIVEEDDGQLALFVEES